MMYFNLLNNTDNGKLKTNTAVQMKDANIEFITVEKGALNE